MIFWYILRKMSLLVYKVLFFVKIEGLENIPKDSGGIICSNHISNFDGPLIVTAVPRKICILTKAEAFKPVIGYFMKIMGCVPVKRDKKDIGTIKKSVDLIKNNELVCLFPEGTRNGLAKGQKLRNGAAFLILAAKAPIIPVGISGNFKPFRKVTIRFGKPVYFDEFYKNKKDPDVYDKINEKMLLNIKMQLTNNDKN